MEIKKFIRKDTFIGGALGVRFNFKVKVIKISLEVQLQLT